ncbi:MAG: hypothetical protein ACTH9T_04820 [Mycetocola reblochoni]|uniref:hypothetical protein n=1 Tax=Mycetocola reblochoni TaxID=331618 RepID=UPI003F99360A
MPTITAPGYPVVSGAAVTRRNLIHDPSGRGTGPGGVPAAWFPEGDTTVAPASAAALMVVEGPNGAAAVTATVDPWYPSARYAGRMTFDSAYAGDLTLRAVANGGAVNLSAPVTVPVVAGANDIEFRFTTGDIDPMLLGQSRLRVELAGGFWAVLTLTAPVLLEYRGAVPDDDAPEPEPAPNPDDDLPSDFDGIDPETAPDDDDWTPPEDEETEPEPDYVPPATVGNVDDAPILFAFDGDTTAEGVRTFGWESYPYSGPSIERTTTYAGIGQSAPDLVMGLEYTRETRTLAHTLLGDVPPDVTLRRTGPRQGVLQLFYATEAAARAAEEMHIQPSRFVVAYPERPSLDGLTYVLAPDQQLSVALTDPDNDRWTLQVPFHEVTR